MAKKYYTFKKYEESRKKTEKFLKALNRNNRKSWKRALNTKKRTRASAAKNTKKSTNKATTQKQTTGPLTFGDIIFALCIILLVVLFFLLWFEWGLWKAVCSTIILFLLIAQIQGDISNHAFDIWGYIFVAIIAIAAILCFALGFWKGLLVSVGICVFAFVLYMFWGEREQPMNTDAYNDDEEEGNDQYTQISYLKDLLEQFDKHKEIINSSDNPDAVKNSLDYLLDIMDEIMTFDEITLRQAGMTKSQMPEQKARVLELYDTMIEQAREMQNTRGE